MTQLEAVRGGITTQQVDAIVNAANSSLLGGGGVDGAIHRAAGPGLLRECRDLRRTTLPGGLPTGQSVATGGHDLPARWVIHTVGPIRHAGETDPALLASCFTTALDVAAEVGARTIAVPAVSAGIYGWDPAEVADIAATAVAAAVEHHDDIDLVRFVLFSDAVLAPFTVRLAALYPRTGAGPQTPPSEGPEPSHEHPRRAPPRRRRPLPRRR